MARAALPPDSGSVLVLVLVLAWWLVDRPLPEVPRARGDAPPTAN